MRPVNQPTEAVSTGDGNPRKISGRLPLSVYINISPFRGNYPLSKASVLDMPFPAEGPVKEVKPGSALPRHPAVLDPQE